MTTTTQTAPSNTLSLSDFTMTSRASYEADLNRALLLSVHTEMEPQHGTGALASGVQSLYDAASGRNHNLDDAGKSTWESMEEPAAYLTDIGVIRSEATGLDYFAPGLRTVRKTREWESLCGEMRNELRYAVGKGISPESYAWMLINSVFLSIENDANDITVALDEKLAQQLPDALCKIWAAADAVCLELDGKLWEQGDEPVVFSMSENAHLDLYSERDGHLADKIVTILIGEHYRGVEARLAASRAKKAATAAAKKKAATKAAKKARKR